MARGRGRPLGSDVRQNVIDILGVAGKSYGYQIHKAYKELFAPVTLRCVYYHLKKGKELGIFKVEKTEKTTGEYSWGPSAEKTFYGLTSKANPKAKKEVKAYFDARK